MWIHSASVCDTKQVAQQDLRQRIKGGSLKERSLGNARGGERRKAEEGGGHREWGRAELREEKELRGER